MTSATENNPYSKRNEDQTQGEGFDYDYYDPHCFFSSGLAQNRRRLGFIATCSTVQCKDGGSTGYDPLLPFKEDLAEWLFKMIRVEIDPDKFYQELQSGVHVCRLGIHMQNMALKYRRAHPEDKSHVPASPPRLKYANATRKSPPFYCRDNISNFLTWSIDFGVKLSCRFETDDLSMRKNDRQIILHLMEVGRLGVRHGIEPPTLIKLEMDIEEEIAEPEPEPEPEPTPEPRKPKKGVSFLDQQVQACAAECTCSVPFKVNRVSEGKYRVGEGRSIVFVRVLRSHVMVRVGGGWETLAAYFSKMDPCRSQIDSFGKAGGGQSNTNQMKQRFQSQEEEPPQTPRSPYKRSVSTEPEIPPPETTLSLVETETDAPPTIAAEEVDPVNTVAPPPQKPKRPAPTALTKTNPSPRPASAQKTLSPIQKSTVFTQKASTQRTSTPSQRVTSSTQKVSAPAQKTPPVQKAPVKAHSSGAPTTPRKTPSRSSLSPGSHNTGCPAKSPVRQSASSPANRSGIPSPRPASASPASCKSPVLSPAPTKASLLRTSPSAIKTPAPSKNPPWRFVPSSTSTPKPAALGRPASSAQKPASRVSGEAGPSTPNFPKQKRDSTLNRTVPPTQNKRLVPVGGKSLPKSDKYNRATQSTSGKPKITSPELIRRAMAIMGDKGAKENEEEVTRKPTTDALKEAIYEIADEEAQCEAQERVDVEIPDSGVDTMVDTKPKDTIVHVNINANTTFVDSNVPMVSGTDTLQDISDMITDDQDKSEMEQFDDLPRDDLPENLTLRSRDVAEDVSEDVTPDEPSSMTIPTTLIDAEVYKPILEKTLLEEKENPLTVGVAEIEYVESALTENEHSSLVIDQVEQVHNTASINIKPAEEYYEGGTTEDELNEACEDANEDGYGSKLSTSSDGQGESEVIDGTATEEHADRFIGITIKSDPRQFDTSPDTEFGRKASYASEGFIPINSGENDEHDLNADFEKDSEDDDTYFEESVAEGKDEDDTKNIYVAENDSAYDISEQIEAINEVERAIAQGDDDEEQIPLTPIPETTEKKREEFKRVQKELQASISEFQRTVSQDDIRIQDDIQIQDEEQLVTEEDTVSESVLTEITELIEEKPHTESYIEHVVDVPNRGDGDGEECQKDEEVLPVTTVEDVEEELIQKVIQESSVEIEEVQQPDIDNILGVDLGLPPPEFAEPEGEEIPIETMLKEDHIQFIPPPTMAKETGVIEDLEVIREEVDGRETQEHPFSEEEVVMKPDKSPLPYNNSLNITPRKYSSDQDEECLSPPKDFVEELKRRRNKRNLNSSGQTSDSDRSTTSDKDTSSGYHEDYETSDGDELHPVPDVIMEQDKSTRSILKGSVRDSQSLSEVSRPSLSSTHSLARSDRDEDEVFEDATRTKGLHLPSEGHVREAVFTKAIEAAIHPLAAPDSRMPAVFDLQSASIVLPSKKAIRKASDGEYGYDDRRSNLERVISNPHTEKSDMQWDEADGSPDKSVGQTRDEKVYKWSSTLRSGPKKKRGSGKKKYSDTDIIDAIEQQMNSVRSSCPVHCKNSNPPVQSGVAPARRPTTAPVKGPTTKGAVTKTPARNTPVRSKELVSATTPLTAPRTVGTPTKTRSPVKRSASTPVQSRPVVKGSKAVAVKPASHVMSPNEVMDIKAGKAAGPMVPPKDNLTINVTKSTPVRRTGSLKGAGRNMPLKSSTLPRDKIRSGLKCKDLP